MTDAIRNVSRRSFLATAAGGASILVANELFGAPTDTSSKPNSSLVNLGAVALAEAKKQGATYADIRIGRYRNQLSGYRLSPERGSNRTSEVPFVTDRQSFGFGVRVIVNGQWGFAASPLVTPEEIARITREAVIVAKANSALQASLCNSRRPRLTRPLDFASSTKIPSPFRWTRNWNSFTPPL